MATIAEPQQPLRPLTRERRFFFIMSLVIAVTVVAGFSLQFVAGRSSLGAPWWVHVHGITMIGWLAIYVTQNWLVLRGEVASHRRLGYLAAGYACWVVLVGLVLTPTSIVAGRTPPFFGPYIFLSLDWLNIVTFAGLVVAGVMARGATDWHRRLMLSSALVVMMPGLGRLVPLPLLGDWMIWGLFFGALPFWAAPAIYDIVTRGKVHHAYYWGFAAFLLETVLIRPLAFTEPMRAIVRHLMA